MDETELPDYMAAVQRDVPRALFVDVQALFPLAAAQAKLATTTSHTLLEGGIPLGVRRGNRLSGLIRFGVTDEAFELLVAKHGGDPVNQVQVSYPDGPKNLPVFLTTARFGQTLVGFASHWEKGDVPTKNASRLALSAQNIGLGADIFRPKELYVDRMRFVVVLVRRDPFDVGKIAGITVAMTDPQMTQLIMQRDINEFLASYGSEPEKRARFRMKGTTRKFRGDDESADKQAG